MRYAIIENDFVVNIIEADEDFISELSAHTIKVDDVICYIGSRYVNGEFILPEPLIINETETE